MDNGSNASRLQTVFDIVALGITIADPQGHILEANRACRRMLGYTLEDLRKLRFADIVHPSDRPLLLQRFQSIRDGRTDSCRTRTRCIARDGHAIWSLVRTAALRDERGDIRYWLSQLEEAQDGACTAKNRPCSEQAEQPLPKGEPVRSPARRVAHDLNNLLMAIQGNISLLLLNKNPNQSDFAYLKKMELAVERASELTRQIQDWARQEQSVAQAADLDPAPKETGDACGSASGIFLSTSEKEVPGKSTPADGRTAPKTILLVEDEEMVADIGRQMLERLGYGVLLARSGQEGLNLYEEHRHSIDLVILDMVMPGMGGAEVFTRLKAINPQVAVLLSSGYIMNSQARETLDSGCRGFIQKPFSIEQLSHKIREVLSDE